MSKGTLPAGLFARRVLYAERMPEPHRAPHVHLLERLRSGPGYKCVGRDCRVGLTKLPVTALVSKSGQFAVVLGL